MVVMALCFARSGTNRPRAQGALPASFGGWTASAPSSVSSPSALGQLLGRERAGLPGIHREIHRAAKLYPGDANRVHYALPPARPQLRLRRLYFLRDDSMSVVNLGSFASASRERALFVVGEMLLDVSAPAKPGAAFRCGFEAACRHAGQACGSHAVSHDRRAPARTGPRGRLRALFPGAAQPGAICSARHGRLGGFRSQRGNDCGALPRRGQGRDAAGRLLPDAADCGLEI